MSERLVSCNEVLRLSVGVRRWHNRIMGVRQLVIRYADKTRPLYRLLNTPEDLRDVFTDHSRFAFGILLPHNRSLEEVERETAPPPYRSLLRRRP